MRTYRKPKETFLTRLVEGMGDITAPFKPCAFYLPALHDLIVVTKDCSYTADRINEWSEIHWENHRPWHKPWQTCVGFTVFLPSTIAFREKAPKVTEVLDRIALESRSDPFGKYRDLFYRLAKDLTVRIGQ